MTYRKKLIEVSLPLEAINVASAREKSIRHGHPSTLHLWWARRPLAACRAVLFSSLVDDPSEYMPDEESARIERERLFGIIEKLVIWENSNDEEVLYEAQLEIARSVARNLNVDVPVGKEAVHEFLATKAPPVLDPFAGGGSIPLEAQRLGLRAYASDLNPVAVLINKALIEIPPKFANMPPVHPVEEPPVKKGKGKKEEGTLPLWQKEWKGAQGLAEDVRYYGQWMRDEAFKRIGHLYPPVTITKEMLIERSDLKERGLNVGDQLTVIAWLWAHTVKCPNPACGAQMPLMRSFALSTKKGKEAWIEPIINRESQPPKISFSVKKSAGKSSDGTVGRAGAHCIVCKTPMSLDYVRTEGQNGRMLSTCTAIVTESAKGGRIYINSEDLPFSTLSSPNGAPETSLPERSIGFSPQLYGMVKHKDLFTKRQLHLLVTLTEMIKEVQERIQIDINTKNNSRSSEYTNAISTYLGMAISKSADYNSSLVIWSQSRDQAKGTFARQVLPIVWDYCEVNPFAGAAGDLNITLRGISEMLDRGHWSAQQGKAIQSDATTTKPDASQFCVSTDPPYYDNVPYANLSDFFYVWLRKGLGHLYPDVFGTVLVPKSTELVADAFRHGSKENAQKFFEQGLTKVFAHINDIQDISYPTTVFYAFKQTEEDNDDEEENLDETQPSFLASTGWETMLEGLIQSGYAITGTWPMRTERASRSRSIGSNALASSVVLVCRPRSKDTASASRREFLSALKKELAPALRELQQGSIAPVDLAQAAIGPGMAVYSRYSAVLEADGKPMSVRTALTLINQALDEFLAEQEGEYDGDTRWALTWFEQYGHNEAAYGVAETLSRAKNTSVDGLSEAGIVEARGGKVRLYRRDELDTNWDPATDKRLTAWESAAHLIYALENGGEESAAELLAKLGPVAEVARDLAYRLYTVCERKGWAQDALGYNMLVVAWPRLKELAARSVKPSQGKLM